MTKVSRRQFLKACALLAATSACEALPNLPVIQSILPTPTATFTPEPSATPLPTATPTPFPSSYTLRQRAQAKNFIYGAALNSANLSDKLFTKKFGEECGFLVPENELKWAALRPAADKFDYAKADLLYDFAKEQQMLFRGHTLVWHSALPPWFDGRMNKQNAESVLNQHITLVMAHYAGKMHSWDVVNEAINPADKREDGLRKTKWLDLLGDSYIEIAFKAAATADNKALLVYNDFGVELDTPEHEAKRVAILKLLTKLKEKKIPIQALGLQGHLEADTMKKQFNAEKFRTFLGSVAALGLKIMITELDVSDQKLVKDIPTRDADVAEVYKAFLTTVLDEKNVIAVLTWGLSDKYTWLSTNKARSDGAKVRPLPLDDSFSHKLAWDTIAAVFEKAPQW